MAVIRRSQESDEASGGVKSREAKPVNGSISANESSRSVVANELRSLRLVESWTRLSRHHDILVSSVEQRKEECRDVHGVIVDGFVQDIRDGCGCSGRILMHRVISVAITRNRELPAKL